jgi:hypothetical protein
MQSLLNKSSRALYDNNYHLVSTTEGCKLDYAALARNESSEPSNSRKQIGSWRREDGGSKEGKWRKRICAILRVDVRCDGEKIGICGREEFVTFVLTDRSEGQRREANR